MGLKMTFLEGEKYQQAGSRGKSTTPKQSPQRNSVQGSLAPPPRQKLKEGLERYIGLLGIEPAEKVTM